MRPADTITLAAAALAIGLGVVCLLADPRLFCIGVAALAGLGAILGVVATMRSSQISRDEEHR